MPGDTHQKDAADIVTAAHFIGLSGDEQVELLEYLASYRARCRSSDSWVRPSPLCGAQAAPARAWAMHLGTTIRDVGIVGSNPLSSTFPHEQVIVAAGRTIRTRSFRVSRWTAAGRQGLWGTPWPADTAHKPRQLPP